KTITEVSFIISETFRKGGKVLLCGNGGSAADAQHIAAELVAKLDKDRTSLPAVALTVDTSLLTAVGNDYGYEWLFHRQVKGLVRKNDIFLAITTSGNSANILRGLEACREVGATSILLTGKGGGKARAMNLADHYVIAPGDHTAQIQEAHIVIYHSICFMVERALIESGHARYF
ncbi:MAG: SIS domain-containing protein, partial [Bdellovibrionaceae bacterium]|nr:SIS domain-containing protein [Pseudobdellovibrionaceae bacterium]